MRFVPEVTVTVETLEKSLRPRDLGDSELLILRRKIRLGVPKSNDQVRLFVSTRSSTKESTI